MPPATMADGEPSSSGATYRGLDSGLAKSAPSAEGLTQKSYRAYRRRLQLFSKQCSRRGKDVAVEGAFLTLSLLQDAAWDAAEQINIDEMESAADPFEGLFKLLDRLYQYEDVELPSRCEEFFGEFTRLKGEEMQAYVIRHATLMKKMKEIKVDIPDLLAGWHMLTRAGVPRWTHVQVKALCGGNLSYALVTQPLLKMFGGDHKPNARDLLRQPQGTQENTYFAEHGDPDWETYETEDDYAENAFYYEAYDGEEAYYGDYLDDEGYEEDAPAELEQAADEVEEAFVNYVESRKKMKDLALARGFYPVVALGPEWSSGDRGKGEKGKGKSKGKGKGKGKGSSKGSGLRRPAFPNRRPAAGVRRQAAANYPSPGAASSEASRSTGTGSTAGHGPRFKRYRLQDAGVKQVPEENVAMVEEYDNHDRIEHDAEEIMFTEVTAGHAIVDSGATRTVVGEDTWKQWLPLLIQAGLRNEVTVSRQARDFRFGDGTTIRSNMLVQFPVFIQDQKKTVSASVIPGKTPMLLARPVLEDWKVMQDFSTGTIKLQGQGDWMKPARTKNGHYLLDLIPVKDRKEDVEMEVYLADAYVETPVIMEPGSAHDDCLLSERAPEEWNCTDPRDIESILEDLDESRADIQGARLKGFWELYVDKGNLSQKIAEKIPGVQVSIFSLPDWDLANRKYQEAFLKLLQKETPDHVWMAPPCTIWSQIQNLNMITDEGAKNVTKRRQHEEETTLKFVAKVFQKCKEMGVDATIEHPAAAVSWTTTAFRGMAGYFEVVVDRCQTGLKAPNEMGVLGLVLKKTKLRTTSSRLAHDMNLRCKCEPKEHVQMIGRGRELKEMQNYEVGFVNKVVRAIRNDMEMNWARRQAAHVMTIDELPVGIPEKEQVVEEHNKQLVRKHGREAVLTIAKLHKQLGHPGREKLVAAAQSSQLGEDLVRTARSYRCGICEAQAAAKPPRPGALSSAKAFNETLLVDGFFVKWRGQRISILAMMDAFSRFEAEAILANDTPDEEIRILEEYWLRWAGSPANIKTDASGSHMSDKFATWVESRGCRLHLIPKDAHYKLGAMERAHAVRRAMLMKMHEEEPDLDLKTAIQYTVEQRNRLRTVHGTSPAQLVFGAMPRQSGITDEPPSTQAAGTEEQQRMGQLRATAAAAFHTANNDRALRASLLARTRTEAADLQVGAYCFYWRPGDKLQPLGRWRGPALLVAVENPQAKPGAATYWLAHGSSLVRCALEQVRPELPAERASRLQQAPATETTETVFETARRVMRPVRGPVRFVDYSWGDGPPAVAGGGDEDPDPDGPEGRDEHHGAQGRDEHHGAQGRDEHQGAHGRDEHQGAHGRDGHQGPQGRDGHQGARERDGHQGPQGRDDHQEPRRRDDHQEPRGRDVHQGPRGRDVHQGPRGRDVHQGPRGSDDHQEPQERVHPGPDDPMQQAKVEEPRNMETDDQQVEKGGERDRSRSPPRESKGGDEATNAAAISSHIQARRLDGLPIKSSHAKEVPKPNVWQAPGELDSDDEKILIVTDEAEEQVLMMDEVSERRLDADQRKAFDKAKDDALRPWIDNKAWARAKTSEAAEGEAVPMRYLLKWKEKDGTKVANARIILQGFKHYDVLTKKLETESPTLSRNGRMLLLQMAAQQGWKTWTADVKSAFLQADNMDEEVRIFATPNADIRRRLARMMGLEDDECMRVLKPAFGDVRAPRFWYNTADRVARLEVLLKRNALDKCLYLSTRLATVADDPFRVFLLDGQECVVDGAFGVHVDDVLAAGEGVHNEDDIKEQAPEQPKTFKQRSQKLLQRFKFGSLDFTAKQTFCGIVIEQSLDYRTLTLSLKDYVCHVKPVTIEKSRKQMVNDLLDEKEIGQLRSILGALAWPAAQCLPMLSVSVSLLQAAMAKPTVNDLVEANKLLRFAKEAVQRYRLTLARHGQLDSLVFGAYTDAAWSVRPDGSSQGGHLVFIASKEQVHGDVPFPLTVIDWASKRLTRVCRSSLSAEAQAAANTVDALEWVKTMWMTILWPSTKPDNEEHLKAVAGTVLITDARSLYDSSTSMSAGMKLNEKRTAIEVAMTQERLTAMGGRWSWCNSHQQLADYMTKSSSRPAALETFSRGMHSLKFDPAMVASKKVSQEEKQRERQALEDAAAEETYMVADKRDGALCQMAGCNRLVEADKGHRFCSRRHYYKHLTRGREGQDEMQRMARSAAAMLAWSQVQPAEGSRVGEEEGPGYLMYYVLGMFVVVSFLAGIFVSNAYHKRLARRTAEHEESEKAAMQAEMWKLHQEIEYLADEGRDKDRVRQRRDDRIEYLEHSERAYERLLEQARAENRPKQASNKSIQGPVQYTRRRATPRFQPLSETQWGAWSD